MDDVTKSNGIPVGVAQFNSNHAMYTSGYVDASPSSVGSSSQPPGYKKSLIRNFLRLVKRDVPSNIVENSNEISYSSSSTDFKENKTVPEECSVPPPRSQVSHMNENSHTLRTPQISQMTPTSQESVNIDSMKNQQASIKEIVKPSKPNFPSANVSFAKTAIAPAAEPASSPKSQITSLPMVRPSPIDTSCSTNKPYTHVSANPKRPPLLKGSATGIVPRVAAPPPRAPSPRTPPTPPPTVAQEYLARHELNPDFARSYRITNELGSGGFGFVVSAERLDGQGTEYAVKFILKSKVGPHQWARDRDLGVVPMEVYIVKNVHHPNVVRFIEYFEDDKFAYMGNYLFFNLFLSLFLYIYIYCVRIVRKNKKKTNRKFQMYS